MHKISHAIIAYMETNNLNTLFVGKNTGWKEGINIGKTNKLKFCNNTINKCNCDVQNIVPVDKRFMYNPVRIKIFIIFEFLQNKLY